MMDNNCLDVELRDQMMAMRFREVTTYVRRCDYLHTAALQHETKGKPTQDLMNEAWRRKMCTWSYMVVDHFGFDREVVEISFNYLDRYMSSLYDPRSISHHKNSTIDKRSFQLIAASSLYVAIKLHGDSALIRSRSNRFHLVGTFVQLSRGLFTTEDILEMEREILSVLQWNLNPPTTVSFVTYLLQSTRICKCIKDIFTKDLPVSGFSICGQMINTNDPRKALYEVTKFFSELSTGDYILSLNAKPSCIAVASLMNALLVLLNGRTEVTNDPTVMDSIIKNAANMLGLSEDEMRSLSQIQLKLKEMCPFPFPSPSVLHAAQSNMNEHTEDTTYGQRELSIQQASNIPQQQSRHYISIANTSPVCASEL